MRGHTTAIFFWAILNPTVGVPSSNYKCANLFSNNKRISMTVTNHTPTSPIHNNLAQMLSEFTTNNLNAKLDLKNGDQVFVSTANIEDVEPVTALIHRAFEVWKQKGLDLSPMHQTSAQTQKHLIGKSIVIKNAINQIIGTVSFDIGRIQTINNKYMFYEGDQDPVAYNRESKLELSGTHFLIFKKLAVHPSLPRSGLGKAILHLAEVMAYQYHFDGIILETVEDADWLYDWYLNENFKTIGTYTYPSRPLQTLLMLKSFNEAGVN
jgi:predicted N-acetyltransferase YhbS